MAQRVNQADFQDEVLHADKVVLAEFYSDSCIPCKRLAPLLADIEERRGDKIKVVKININYDLDLASEYRIMASPTIILFRQGAEISRLRGSITKDELEQLVSQIID